MLEFLSKSLTFPSASASASASASLPSPPPPPPPPSHSQGTSESDSSTLQLCLSLSNPVSFQSLSGSRSSTDTDATSSRSSPTPNVTSEYDLAVQAPSYSEIRSMIQAPPQHQLHQLDLNDQNNDEDSHHRQVLAQVLQPDRQSVREALARSYSHAPRSTLTRLVSDYFDHSENTCDLCLFLHRSVHRARTMYAPLFNLIAVLPDNDGSISKHHSDLAYDIFLQFDCHDNPFVFPDARNFTTMRRTFSELRQQIESRRRKSHYRIRLIRRATASCAFCVIASVVGAVVSTVLVTTHAVAGFAMLVAAPCCNQYIPHPKRSERKELARLKQLDAAAKGTFVVNDLDTIDSLLDRLQTAVEGHKALVRFALERGREKHPIQEVLKQLRKNQHSFQHQLEDLEEHIFLCFNTVNKARLSLLQEISLH